VEERPFKGRVSEEKFNRLQAPDGTSRRNLKHDALILASAHNGRAKNISFAIDRHTSVG
jgi:hypothetical protein